MLNLPSKFTISEGDNELFIDTENILLLELFKNSIKIKNRVAIKEFLLDGGLPIKNTHNQYFSNQLVAALVRSDTAYSYAKYVKGKNKPLGIEYASIPKEPWVFLKLYCKAGKVDYIL